MKTKEPKKDTTKRLLKLVRTKQIIGVRIVTWPELDELVGGWCVCMPSGLCQFVEITRFGWN